MKNREDVILYCKSFDNVVEDYPFHDDNWTLMRHAANKKTFACIYEHCNNIWINVKCSPEWSAFWRNSYKSVVPAYHMNKEHWNSIILDGTVPVLDIKKMICESYDLTKSKNRKAISK